MRLRVLAATTLALACTAAAPAPAPGARLLDDVRILSADDMQGREVGAPGGAKARSYILGRIRQIGMTPVGAGFEQAFTFQEEGRTVRGVNLVAKVDGAGRSDRVLVVTAHYDHEGVKKGEIYNGADDNASGVAAALALAESLRQTAPEHTVILAFLDGEEAGLQGAKAFVAAPPVPLSRIAAAINLDMVGRGDKGEIFVAGATPYPFLRPRLEALAAAAPVRLKLGHDGAPPWTGHDDWTKQSDHYAFHQKGVPWIYFGVEDHPDYHRPTDDFDKIPQAFFKGASETITAAARLFDRDLDAIASEAGRAR
ncbi:M20/M25/M40 family metallo-hydrolase [Phenylobacterium deserti]|uniref:Peptidase M20 n=1 Tax=Phenylobacterium deserti TaxID=1914756 RepID=A0A328AYF1_9CAUL|nr:M20/M25/M40 family metallo-hydrolase [Phenylobacterium deserti]RAK57858.1 peptidase M20 [Phenylobacterium deserti]